MVPALVLALFGGASVRAAGWTTRLCGVGFTGPTRNKCFGPRQAGTAESRLPVPPFRPTQAVQRYARLSLEREVLYDVDAPYGLGYLYGRIPEDLRGLPAFALRAPHYVIVTERVGRNRAFAGKVVYTGGRWEYDANFPRRSLSLQVQSNISRKAVRQIGQAIIALDVTRPERGK